MKARRLVALALVVLSLGACDLFGPSGPGTLDATLTGPTPLGAALLEVSGLGIQGFVGQGDTRVYGAEVNATTGTHRVVAISASGGVLSFGIKVADLGMDLPLATVMKVANPANIVVLSTQVVVEISKP